ncbi:MAG: family 78 glycoside hydrolase catalytic domain [Acidimicrobiales bacterium]|nr:family 78 glycoside hydrolase catalytic domain [Acidimicrobiales bacterium]
MTRPDDLRVEHRGADALGVGTPTPRLSWRLPVGARAQRAYDVELADGRAQLVESDRHVLATWPFEPLASRARVSWRVRTWTDAGVSGWSAPHAFEVGLLVPVDWSARWVAAPVDTEQPDGGRAPHLLRHGFTLDSVGEPARLHATAHGVYETFLNGRRVGDHELAPGFTDYPTTLHVQTFDVADLLVAGENIWEVVVSDGWFRGRHGTAQRRDGFGTQLAFLGQLEAGDLRVVTGDGWQATTTGPIRSADLMAGQVEDRRVAATGWRPALVTDHDLGALRASPAPPVRRVDELRPVSVRAIGPDRHVVDLGQNITGWLRLADLGPAGTELTLVHGEALDPAGDVTTENLRVSDEVLDQVDQVASAGVPGDVFEPRHTVHGFQYVRVEGHPGPLTPDDAVGVVVHTDLERTGWFRCSDDRINRLHEIATWSFRDNACDIPTDCPHRERSGWTGDWQLFLPSAAFLYDVAGFSTKWLRDLAAEQLPDGLLPNYVPDPRRSAAVATGDLTWFGMLGSAGWGDACVLVPWDLYRLYGDEQVLAELWPAMVGWLDYAANAARTRRHPARAEARPEPAPHEAFLWDGGWHWGEWCEPATGGEPFYVADQGMVATAYLHHTAALAARIGRRLGHDDRAAAFDELAEGALAAWRAEYLADDGTLVPQTQAEHVRALAFSLVPEASRSAVATRLVELIRAAGTHLGTGFLATPSLLPVLADAGHLDVAYELLFQDTPPSWLAMVDRGATTIWESWEGVDDEGVAHESLNHYSKGAVIDFLHRYVAGLRPSDGEGPDEVAYRRFRVEPRPGGGITWAEAAHDSPYGLIEVAWRVEGDELALTVTVPPGTSAEITLPDGRVLDVGPGRSGHRSPLP